MKWREVAAWLLVLVVTFAGCQSLRDWANSPIAPPEHVRESAEAQRENLPDEIAEETRVFSDRVRIPLLDGTWIEMPRPANEPMTVEIPNGAGGTYSITLEPVPGPAPGTTPTQGDAVVEGVAGILGSVNPMLGWAALAVGRMGLGALRRREGDAEA